MTIILKRAYDPPADDDGYRILVDRLWPRGVSQASGRIDLWLRDLAPTSELRTWFGHQVEHWVEFGERYRRELGTHPDLLDLVLDIEQHRKRVTLVFGARDEEHNEARVLADVLADRPSHSHR